jgi:hypothetical protein
LIGEFVSPNGHYFFDIERARGQQFGIGNPSGVCVCDVIDAELEIVSAFADVEFADESCKRQSEHGI